MDGFLDLCESMAFLVERLAANSLPLFVTVCVLAMAGRHRLSARVRFAMWTLVLVRMILPFSLQTPFALGRFFDYGPQQQSLRAVAVLEFCANAVQSVGVEDPSSHDDPVVHPPQQIRWLDLLVFASIVTLPVIGMLLAAWLAAMTWRLRSRIRQGLKPCDPEWEELVNQGCQVFGIRAKVRPRVLPGWSAPATFGFFRPVIILPANSDTLTTSQKRHVVWHELAHIQRGDAAWNLLGIIVACVHWWNPCFWLAQRFWLAERELACDALAIQHLGSSPADYGRTLLHFLDELSRSGRVSRSLPVLGLFLGSKSEMVRRLKALGRLKAAESRWHLWGSFVLLVLLAVTGMTDFAASKVERTQSDAIRLPSGTTWQLSPSSDTEPSSEPLPESTQFYDTSKALARVQQDEPDATADYFRDLVPYCGIFPWLNGKPRTDKVSSQGDKLVVTATELQHQAIRRFLDQWEQFGIQQICIEVRILTTAKQPTEIIARSGGKIISPAPFHHSDDLMAENPQHSVNQLVSGPTFVSTLAPTEVSAVMTLLMGDRRSNALFAPKVTIFSGTTAHINDLRKRPFVTGLRTTEEGQRQPQISTVGEGMQVRMMATLIDADNNIELNLQLRNTEITDVETLTTRFEGQADDVCVQVPHLRETYLKTTVKVADGTTYLIAPLLRRQDGNFQIYLFTSRLIRL